MSGAAPPSLKNWWRRCRNHLRQSRTHHALTHCHRHLPGYDAQNRRRRKLGRCSYRVRCHLSIAADWAERRKVLRRTDTPGVLRIFWSLLHDFVMTNCALSSDQCRLWLWARWQQSCRDPMLDAERKADTAFLWRSSVIECFTFSKEQDMQ